MLTTMSDPSAEVALNAVHDYDSLNDVQEKFITKIIGRYKIALGRVPQS